VSIEDAIAIREVRQQVAALLGRATDPQDLAVQRLCIWPV